MLRNLWIAESVSHELGFRGVALGFHGLGRIRFSWFGPNFPTGQHIAMNFVVCFLGFGMNICIIAGTCSNGQGGAVPFRGKNLSSSER